MEAKQSLGSRLESGDRVGVWDQVKGRRLDEGTLKSSQMQAQPLPEARDRVAARNQIEGGGWVSVRSRPGAGSWTVMEMVALVVAVSRRGRGWRTVT